MPFVYPLDPAEFLEQLPVRSIDLELPEVAMMSRTEGGDVLVDTVGDQLWRGEVVLDRMTPSEARQATSLINVARGGDASFMVYDLRHFFPASDPGGTAVQAAAIVIRRTYSDARLLALRGLPTGFAPERGDYLSFTYGTNPERRAFHQIVEQQVQRNVNGDTFSFEVRPALQPGATAGSPVSFFKPAFKAVIVPGSVQPGRSSRFVTDGMSFQFQQTLR